MTAETLSPYIIDSVGRWPYPAVAQDDSDNNWYEISEEHADDILGSVPPIYIPGGFMNGEPYTHDRGIPVYLAVITINDRRFAQMVRYDHRGTAHLRARAAMNGVEW